MKTVMPLTHGLPNAAAMTPEVSGQRAQSATDKERARVADAAKQFEGIFVRQLLEASKVMGSANKGSSGGYGSMAIEALSDGLLRAGGFGLAKQIEASLALASRPAPVSEEKNEKSAAPSQVATEAAVPKK